MTIKNTRFLTFSAIALFFMCSFSVSVNAQNNYKYQYEIVKIDSLYDKDADLTMETYLSYLKKEKDKVMSQFMGISKEVLVSNSPASPLSNLLVDMLFDWGNEYLLSKKMAKADLALLNFGGIRAALPQGKITVGDIYEILPFDNTVAFVSLKGAELQKMFDRFSGKKAPLANVKTIYNANELSSVIIGGAPLELNKIYTMVTINFLATGGDGFLSGLHFESENYLPNLLRDVFMEYIREKTAQGIEIEGSIDDRCQ